MKICFPQRKAAAHKEKGVQSVGVGAGEATMECSGEFSLKRISVDIKCGDLGNILTEYEKYIGVT